MLWRDHGINPRVTFERLEFERFESACLVSELWCGRNLLQFTFFWLCEYACAASVRVTTLVTRQDYPY